jgi:hypothetical protein
MLSRQRAGSVRCEGSWSHAGRLSASGLSDEPACQRGYTPTDEVGLDSSLGKVCTWQVPRISPGNLHIWWRRGESNPRPQALHFRLYVRSCLFGFSPHATRAAGKTLGQLTVSLNAVPRSTVQRDPVSASPGSVAQAPAGRRLSRIKRLERSCRRWQLKFAQEFNEDPCTSVRP